MRRDALLPSGKSLAGWVNFLKLILTTKWVHELNVRLHRMKHVFALWTPFPLMG